MIEIVPISDDNGFAVCLGELRVDVFPPNEIDTESFVSITEPRMSIEDVRKFALLLLAAVEFAESGGITQRAADLTISKEDNDDLENMPLDPDGNSGG